MLLQAQLPKIHCFQLILSSFFVKTHVRSVFSEIGTLRHFSNTTNFNSTKKSGKPQILKDRPFVDRIRVNAKGGDGGPGCASFRKSRLSRNGSADGGNGGTGGDVVLKACTTVRHLAGIQHSQRAGNGGSGKPKKKIGTTGQDQVIKVPVGTVVWLLDGTFPNSSVEEWSGSSSGSEIGGSKNLLSPTFTTNSLTISSEESIQNKQTQERSDTDLGPIRAEEGMVGRITDIEVHDKNLNGDEILEADDTHTVALKEHAEEREEEQLDETEGFYEEEEKVIRQRIAGRQVADLDVPGQTVLLSRGGRGGHGNASMPGRIRSREAEPGQKGTAGSFLLELKSVADIGLVGAPNAGKSTLLSGLSRANPKTGSYAFTTLKPQLGSLDFGDFSRVTVADVPGLIAGASRNRGLGHGFLRHVERTKILVLVVDVGDRKKEKKGSKEGGEVWEDCGEPWEVAEGILGELKEYEEGLEKRVKLVVGNKMDEEEGEYNLKVLREKVWENLGGNVPVIGTCAVLGEGVEEVKDTLRRLVDKLQED